jgi:death on curing protein
LRHYRVSLRDVLEAHAQSLQFGGRPGIRSLELIESAIGRPYSGYYRSLAKKAAALTQSLAKNHGFVDANKRTTALIVLLLIKRSRYIVSGVDADIGQELERLILDVVENRISLEQVIEWFEARLEAAR